MEQDLSIPVIAIDGGAGTGKGTVRSIIAKRLGFHNLDSGALYRAVAVVSIRKNIHHEDGFVEIANNLDIKIEDDRVFVNDEDITEDLRTLESDTRASVTSKVPGVRSALLDFQFKMRKQPGLVADGRDMGQIFSTPHKFFLVAKPEARAKRRINQHKERGVISNYDEVLAEIVSRDERDSGRSINPAKPHPEAVIIDTTEIGAEEVADVIMSYYLKNQ
jgi:cytidylate kinase